MLRKMPFILFIILATLLILAPFIPLPIKQILYALSLSVKSIILLLLPIIIFGLLFKTMVDLAGRATLAILFILVCVCCSNTLSTFLSHYLGSWIYQFDLSLIRPKDGAGLMPAWKWQLPSLIANEKAMFLGIALGIALGNTRKNLAKKFAEQLNWLIAKILHSFIYLIPIFVTGFVVQLQFNGVIYTIIKDYTFIFLLVAFAQFSYIFCAYIVVNHFKLKPALACIKNMLPAALTGFSTMSSAAAMPLTLIGTRNNVNNKDLSASVVPATVNIHLIGDCLAIPIFAYAVMKSFGVAEPLLASYLIFTFYFVMAKFSVAAIPGGGIIVMLPLLENYLGFNTEMLSLITALYILFDPVITCANVLGNGAFAKLIDISFKWRI